MSAGRGDRLVPARGDPRREAELVEQLRHLPGGLVDQLDEAGLRARRLRPPSAGPRESGDGRKRCPEIVAGQLDEGREAIACGRPRRARAQVCWAAPRRRTRFSVPARSRRRFERCSTITAAAGDRREDDDGEVVAEHDRGDREGDGGDERGEEV